MEFGKVIRLLNEQPEEGPSFSAGLVYSLQFAEALLEHPLPR
jgi:hypothetical protein